MFLCFRFFLLIYLPFSFLPLPLSLSLQLKLDELVSQESSTQLKEQLLSREKLLVQQQNDWLTKELELKNTQVFELKKERASILTEKEMLVTSKEQEVRM